jgi:hypothetical protein
MSVSLRPMLQEVLDELAMKSRKAIYRRDFEAWKADLLGERTYQRLAAIGDDVLFGRKERSFIKSANGASKTFESARWATWWVTAFPPEESLAIITAPTLPQVERGIFSYMKKMYGYVKSSALQEGRLAPWPGRISDSAQTPEWTYNEFGGGKQVLAFGKVPSPRDAVSTFQGQRKEGGRTFLCLDEAGGVDEAIFTAMEALITGSDSRMLGIGNPDRRGTPFHRKFTVPEEMAESNLFTISAYDLPTMTGEVVYPGEPEKQELMLRGLTSKRWIANKERLWASGGELVPDEEFPDDDRYIRRVGEIKWDARGLAKVMGEFPGETDNAFFPQEAIDIGHATEIHATEAPVVLGVDVARYGEDESVVMVNVGGRVRVFDGEIPYHNAAGDVIGTTKGTWAKESTVQTARRVVAIAKEVGAERVQLDAAGIGGSVYDDWEDPDLFPSGVPFLAIGINGGNRSRDKNQWANQRAEQHDNLRKLLLAGKVDIDHTDDELRDQLLNVTYKFTQQGGAVQITPKDEMRGPMGGSPDRLDALIYAVADMTPVLDNPYGDLKPGERVYVDPGEFADVTDLYSPMFGV